MTAGAWELWSNDSFDRESEPSPAGSGTDFVAGCAGLWRKTVDEGVQADGRPTFTWFTLHWDGGRLSVPRDPLTNPELARLKGWVGTPGVIGALAKSVAGSPTGETARRCLDAVAAASDAFDLCSRLGHPAKRPSVKRFDFAETAPLLKFLGSPEAATATALTVDGPGVGQDGVLALASAQSLGQLSFLWIDEVALGDEGVALLAQLGHFPALRTLGLCDCGLADRGAAALAAAPWADGLLDLTLSNRANSPPARPNTLGDEGARALAASDRFGRLQTLDLGFSGVGDTGVAALLGPGRLPALRELIVWHTRVTQEGATRAAQLNRGRAVHCVVHSDFTPRMINYSDG